MENAPQWCVTGHLDVCEQTVEVIRSARVETERAVRFPLISLSRMHDGEGLPASCQKRCQTFPHPIPLIRKDQPMPGGHPIKRNPAFSSS